MADLKPAEGVTCDAVLSEDGRYRYELSRVWRPQGGLLMVVGINPSTADAHTDDRTIAKLTRMARRLSFGGLLMSNLFAYRSTDPKALRALPYMERVGPQCDEYLLKTVERADRVLCAWGSDSVATGRAPDVISLLLPLKDLYCLKTAKYGEPCHPLYLSETLPLKLWRKKREVRY